MQTFVAGRDISVSVPLLTGNDNYLVPDQGSVKYTVRDHSGTEIAGLIDVAAPVDILSTHVIVTIPLANTDIGSDRLQFRTVEISFTQGGNPHYLKQVIRLTPWLNHVVTHHGVRDTLGVSVVELPDSSIDITEAYFEVEDEVSQTTLETALSSGTTSSLKANRMVEIKAALAVIPTLIIRVSQKETHGAFQFERSGKMDFRETAARLSSEYDELLEVVSPPDEYAPEILNFATITDVITGS